MEIKWYISFCPSFVHEVNLLCIPTSLIWFQVCLSSKVKFFFFTFDKFIHVHNIIMKTHCMFSLCGQYLVFPKPLCKFFFFNFVVIALLYWSIIHINTLGIPKIYIYSSFSFYRQYLVLLITLLQIQFYFNFFVKTLCGSILHKHNTQKSWFSIFVR